MRDVGLGAARRQARRLNDEALLLDDQLVTGVQARIAHGDAVDHRTVLGTKVTQGDEVAVQLQLAVSRGQRRLIQAQAGIRATTDHQRFGHRKAATEGAPTGAAKHHARSRHALDRRRR